MNEMTKILSELNTNENEHKAIFDVIEQSIKTATSMSKSIIELYNKVDILTKRVEELERGIKTEVCPVCEGAGYIESEPGAFADCSICRGTGKINVMTKLED